jgi:hypothetical protein
MPALESRRVRTQPLTVTGASCGALPSKILRTLDTPAAIFVGACLSKSLCRQVLFPGLRIAPAQARER